MRLAVLGSPTSWYLQDLQRAANDEHELTSVSFHDLGSRITSGELTVSAKDCRLNAHDAVLVRTMPPGSLEQVVFRMDALAQLQANGTAVVNSPRAIEAAVDKYLATARLRHAGFQVPETYACQTASQAMQAFEQLGGRAVIKPLFGGEGRGVALLDDSAMARRAFSLLESLGGVILLQQYIEHEGADMRLFVAGERVLGMRRVNPNDWRTNISLGGQAEPMTVTDDLAEQAIHAARAVGALVAGVDFLPGCDGQLYALEVNAVPGWRALQTVSQEDVARLVLRTVVAEIGRR